MGENPKRIIGGKEIDNWGKARGYSVNQFTIIEIIEDEILYPLAMQRVKIDLDDGVKVNYKKFGKALKGVKGLSG